MKGQTHYVNVDQPNLKEGRDLDANCGARIKKAIFAGEAIDANSKELRINSLTDCSKCWNKGFDKRYIYPIVEGKKSEELC